MSTNTESDTADAQPATTPNVESETAPETEPEIDTQPEPEVKTEVEPEPDLSVETDTDADGETDTESESEPDSEGDDDAEEVVTSPPQQFTAAVKGGAIKEFVSTLRAIVDEAKIRVGPDGIHTRAVDPANVAMYDVSLAAGAFESYDATEGILGVNLERFEEVLKLAKKNDLVQLSFNTTSFKLVIHIDGVEFTMALIDPDSIRKEPEIPEMDLPISLTLEEAQISRGVKAADMVSDHIRFRCDEAETTVYIEAEGDTDNVSLELADDDLAALTAADGNALYSLDYVNDISKQFPKGTEITLTFGGDFPMMFEYQFSDGECDVLAMLAPRIQSD
ncbi:DNA polymerase sliding clamp [Halorubrum sp. CGM5_25_10-8B]|uniref:DNA polymerase sliding clamp n=1 Tax=Halorubrum sp. CGM5_25_10-8B TaxID=2518115 RepID=UPI0018EEC754|nr:DNA polymerase sliding clamp [Halorubrum sp. CGM5_25_10-8B]